MTGARPDTWMPIYWGDYLRDTMHLRAEAHGAYLLLICHYWMNGGALPDDDDHLSAVARLDDEAWQRIRPKIEPFFHIENGKWFHYRIESELAKAKHITETRRAAGKQGGSRSAEARAKSQPKPKQTTKQKATPSQPPSPISSDPNGSGANGAERPLKDQLFGVCLDWLAEQSERPRGSLKSMVGKWISTHGEAKTLEAITEAQKHSAVEPVAYVNAELGNTDRKWFDD